MPSSPAKTLVETSYNRLRSDIIAGKLAPGAKLRIEELREDYQIGASPLREALNRLAGEGFVTVEEQRGFKVAPISLDDLQDLSRMRIMLECEALRDSIRNGDDEWEANLVAAYHRLQKAEQSYGKNLAEWERRNEEFHESLVAACVSPWLLRLRHILYEQHKRYRFIAILTRDEDRDVPPGAPENHGSYPVTERGRCLYGNEVPYPENAGNQHPGICRTGKDYRQLRPVPKANTHFVNPGYRRSGGWHSSCYNGYSYRIIVIFCLLHSNGALMHFYAHRSVKTWHHTIPTNSKT